MLVLARESKVLTADLPIADSQIDDRLLAEVALSRSEYGLLVEKLGRQPTLVELAMTGAMWSEHCGYKSSKPLLKLFPTTGPRVIQGPGENAGVLDIGEGLALVMKIESHNHPSAVEPYQGAATGVGGIIRDIFTMGARPIALLNSLRFGLPDVGRTSYLLNGVVAGIGGYGNCIGIPTVGGEVYFAAPYADNPLVNAMCAGVARQEEIILAAASGVGNSLMLVGADTGRDGIHGATFASDVLAQDNEQKRPAVQVGNPFLEKLLLEACLELAKTDHIVGMQDLGAAGLTSSSVECASRGGAGVILHTDRVSRRESGMTAYEVMLSESQERMLIVVKRGREAAVKAICDRWDLHSDIVGEVTDDGLVRIVDAGREVAAIPAHILTDEVPVYQRPSRRPAYLDAEAAFDLAAALPRDPDYSAALLRLLAQPNLRSKGSIYHQYDHTIQSNTVLPPGQGDAAVVRLKDWGSQAALAFSTDCNSVYCYLDPYRGGQLAVAEAARNVVCVGATPLAVTDCLNFGSPENPEVFYQFEQAVHGLADACRSLDIPVISGNVSLYNETSGVAVYPTPVVGMAGLLPDASKAISLGLKHAGHQIVLLGLQRPSEGDGLGGSEYATMLLGQPHGRPASLDAAHEANLYKCYLKAAAAGYIHAGHDCSEGGVAVTLSEMCVGGGLGAEVWAGYLFDESDYCTATSVLFGEWAGRILCEVSNDDLRPFVDLCSEFDISIYNIGEVTAAPRLQVRSFDDPQGDSRLLDLSLADLHQAYGDI